MRKVVVPGLIFGIWASPALAEGSVSESVRATHPVALSEAQMDRVTAGAAGVDITAEAVAVGASGTLADTDTRTRARANRKVTVANGNGRARARGEWRDVELSASLFADGEVLASHIKSVEIDNPAQALAILTAGIVVRN